ATAGSKADGVARGHGRRAFTCPCYEQCLFDLVEEIAAFVGGAAVDAQPDADAGVEEVAHRSDARTQAHVRRRAVRDADAACRQTGDVGLREMDTMRAPDVIGQPAQLPEVLDRRATVELAAIVRFLDGLRQVR